MVQAGVPRDTEQPILDRVRTVDPGQVPVGLEIDILAKSSASEAFRQNPRQILKTSSLMGQDFLEELFSVSDRHYSPLS